MFFFWCFCLSCRAQMKTRFEPRAGASKTVWIPLRGALAVCGRSPKWEVKDNCPGWSRKRSVVTAWRPCDSSEPIRSQRQSRPVRHARWFTWHVRCFEAYLNCSTLEGVLQYWISSHIVWISNENTCEAMWYIVTLMECLLSNQNAWLELTVF